jgi:hypothetical protein
MGTVIQVAAEAYRVWQETFAHFNPLSLPSAFLCVLGVLGVESF